MEFLRAGLLETVNLATLWVDAGHDMADGAILSGAVHPLKDHQQCELIGAADLRPVRGVGDLHGLGASCCPQTKYQGRNQQQLGSTHG